MNKVPMTYPSDWNDFPPDWMKPDVEHVLTLVDGGLLYTRTGPAELGYGWVKPDADPSAQYAGPEQSETAHILVERGYLLWGDSTELIDESGERFTADRLVFTPAGRQLYDQLRQRK